MLADLGHANTVALGAGQRCLPLQHPRRALRGFAPRVDQPLLQLARLRGPAVLATQRGRVGLPLVNLGL